MKRRAPVFVRVHPSGPLPPAWAWEIAGALKLALDFVARTPVALIILTDATILYAMFC